jgi:mannose-6-phosphate isomerase
MSLNELWTTQREAVFGASLVSHPAPRFPLLMKILDACEDLSLQVHPPASVAAPLGGEPKTEAWFIAQASPNARLYAGLRPGTTREIFEQALTEGTVAELAHILRPVAGDCLFLPSGRLHAIGAGLLVFEIQQNSDTTYRVFDWHRLGLDGQPRPLHLAESLASIDFSDWSPGFQPRRTDGQLVACSEFVVRHCRAQQNTVLGTPGENLTVALLSGDLTSSAGTRLQPGDFAIVPAALSASQRRALLSDAETDWLEIAIPAWT